MLHEMKRLSRMRHVVLLGSLALSCIPPPSGVSADVSAKPDRAYDPDNPPMTLASPPIGFPNPFVIEHLSLEYQWTAACFAMHDTDANGTIAVEIGRHGHTFGDELTPYLFVNWDEATPIDTFIGSSPDGRFVAFVERGRLWLLDAKTAQRQDLSELGTSLQDDDNAALDHPATTFSSRGELMLVRRTAHKQDVLLLDLVEGTRELIYETKRQVWRVQFDPDTNDIIVFEVPSEKVSPVIATTLAPRGCRGRAAVYSTMGVDYRPDAVVLQPRRAQRPSTREMLRFDKDCIVDGREALIKAEYGHHLVAPKATGANANHGPIQWVRTVTHVKFCAKP